MSRNRRNAIGVVTKRNMVHFGFVSDSLLCYGQDFKRFRSDAFYAYERTVEEKIAYITSVGWIAPDEKHCCDFDELRNVVTKSRYILNNFWLYHEDDECFYLSVDGEDFVRCTTND